MKAARSTGMKRLLSGSTEAGAPAAAAQDERE